MNAVRTGDANEHLRLEELNSYSILDTDPERQFDDIVSLAASICGTPMALITLVDEKRQWFKSRLGLELRETARDIAFCAYTIAKPDIFIVRDAREDPRFSGNPLVAGDPNIVFYAGMPLTTRSGYALGSLAVLDRVPRTLTDDQLGALRILGKQVVAQLELRKTLASLQEALIQKDTTEECLRQSHAELERRVADRTSELNQTYASLRDEFEERTRQANLSQDIIDSLPGIFYVFDETGRFLRWNRNFELVTEYSEEEVKAMHPLDLFSAGGERERVARRIAEVLQEGRSTVEADVLTRSGKRIPYYLTGVRIELAGKPYVSGMGIDITERRRSEETLRLHTRAIEASVNAIVITDAQGNIEYANSAFERITGYRTGEVLGRNCRFLQGSDTAQPGIKILRDAIRMHEDGRALLRNYRKSGDMFWNDVHIAPVRSPAGTVSHYVGVLNDMTEVKNYEEELERQANFDSLTALVNRSVLKDRIRQAVAAAQRHGTSVAVGFMDLDNFKFINDSLGHNVGDELLKRVAERLVSCMRGQDTIARYGGDEFAFVLTEQRDEAHVAALMDRLLKTVDRPFDVDGHRFFISCSIGLSFFPRDGKDPDTLLKNADAAMYRAKERGRNNFQFYTPAMNQRIRERLSLESRLRQAIENDEFMLHYQPKVNLHTGKIVGAEALLRWRPAEGDLVPPATFIPLAEETGLIIPIGDWVLRTACAHSKTLQDVGLQPLGVAVNISARQFEPRTICATVNHALASAGLAASFLELELTESLVMDNPEEVIKVLCELKEMGLRLSIDDFGTGYSSLSYLQRFPVDRLKIDQSFVRDIGADPNDAIIARAIISLGHNLGMSVIAEGVSTAEQLAFLRENGCDEMQGYLFSRPVPFEEMMLLLKDDRVLAT